jgi:diacylglycerol kinase family enzyme
VTSARAEPAPHRAPVFLNRRAGTGAGGARHLEERLGAAYAHVLAVPADALRDHVERAIEDGEPLIGIAGGDGSMRTAAAALAGTNSALLAVPTGTLNHFARRCGIESVEDAAAALRDPHFRTLPAGRFDGGIFLNTLTIGEYSRTVRVRERWRRYVGKWPAALIGMTATVTTARRFDIAIATGEDVLERHTAFVWIGVGWGSFPRVHEALERRHSPDLEVAVLRSASRRAMLAFMVRVGWRMLRGVQPVRDAALDVRHGRSITITAHRRIDATADGEIVRLPSPLRVTVSDDALRVVTGAPTLHSID